VGTHYLELLQFYAAEVYETTLRLQAQDQFLQHLRVPVRLVACDCGVGYGPSSASLVPKQPALTADAEKLVSKIRSCGYLSQTRPPDESLYKINSLLAQISQVSLK